MKTPISQSTAKTNAKKYNDYFNANYQTYKTMKRSKRIELTENTIKVIAKEAIDKGTCFKLYVEKLIEKEAINIVKKEL